MTQEQKDLLLKDLCARLPYGVKVQSTFYNCDGTIWKYETETLTAGLLVYPIQRYKPYLFPLSSMTEEQSKIYHELIGGMFGTSTLVNFEVLEDFFHKNHLDYRGLIPMGLAINATGLNIY